MKGEKVDNTAYIDNDKNMMVVFAVEEYARKYNLLPVDAFRLFMKRGVIRAIRDCYEVLHTQSIDESLSFAEDYLERRAS
jgi:hypothetical protein